MRCGVAAQRCWLGAASVAMVVESQVRRRQRWSAVAMMDARHDLWCVAGKGKSLLVRTLWSCLATNYSKKVVRLRWMLAMMLWCVAGEGKSLLVQTLRSCGTAIVVMAALVIVSCFHRHW